MEYIRDTTEVTIKEPTVLSLGKFDGLHRGHKLLVSAMREKQKEGLAAVMFTFDIPPRRLIGHELASVLTTGEEKEYLFGKTGIDYLIEYPFTQEVRSCPPEDFLRFLADRLNVKCIVAGKDFRFGRDRAGNYETLLALGPKLGFEAMIVEKMRDGDREISSSFIREELSRGNLDKANQLLGYPYFVGGTVTHGRSLGHEMGIPTVNLLPPAEKQLPPFGVYVAKAVLEDGREYGGIANVGNNPTVGGANPVDVETHILDFTGDLYGKRVMVHFLKFLREERKFPSVGLLKEQIALDAQSARDYLKNQEKNIT